MPDDARSDLRVASDAPATGARPAVPGWFAAVVATGVAFAVLSQAADFLVPLVIAVLIFSLTSGAIDWIAARRLGPLRAPRWLATLAGVAIVAAVVLALIFLVSAQIDALAAAAPAYIARTQTVIADLIARLDEDLAEGVEAAFSDLNPVAYLRMLAGSAGTILVTTLVVFIYVGFLLAERARFVHKLGLLFADPERAAAVERIIESIARSVHRYVLVKTFVSAATGAMTYGVLFAFDLAFVEMLSFATFLLNFIPNIGSMIAVALAVAVALVQFDSWGPVLTLLTILTAIQFTVGNIVEPMVMGRSLQLSTFVVVLSLMFWGALWGFVGMFLAVPLTVMIMIVCAHVPALRPLAILLSRDGDLATDRA